jgi:uracil-DNA glycosylase
LPVVLTYHPEHLLKQPKDKAKAWQDLLLARSLI